MAILALITTSLTLGLSASTSCTALCLPVLLPYLASGQDTRIMSSLGTVGLFSLGRLVSYTALGLAVVFLLGSVNISPALISGVNICLGVLLAVYGLYTLGAFSARRNPAAKACNCVASSRPHFYMGMLVGLRPCVPLLAALVYTVQLSDVFQVVAFMFFFCLASSLIILVAACAGRGVINLIINKIGLPRMRRLSGLVLIFTGLFFVLQGAGGLLSGYQPPQF